MRVAAPADANQRIAYLSTLEQIEIEPGDAPARVIVNSRTGTVVIGSHVRVMPAAVAHGSLSVTIVERASVSQPYEFSRGETVAVPESTINVDQPAARMFVFDAGVDLNDIVRAVNQVGAAPGDLVGHSRGAQGIRCAARRVDRHLTMFLKSIHGQCAGEQPRSA